MTEEPSILIFNRSSLPAMPQEIDLSDDQTLAQQWKTGDRRAYEILVRRHLPPIHRYLISRSIDRNDVDDLCQNVFLDLATKIHLYNPQQPFLPWLFGIARNHSRQYWKKHHLTEEFQETHSPSDELDPARIIELNEEHHSTWSRVFRLIPESQATILWLRVSENLTLHEISVRTGESLSNVKVLLFRARRYLASVWPRDDQTRPTSQSTT